MSTIKMGDKIWIRHGLGFSEAEITGLPNDGALVEFRMPLDGGRLGSLAKFLRYYFEDIELREQFKSRIV